MKVVLVNTSNHVSEVTKKNFSKPFHNMEKIELFMGYIRKIKAWFVKLGDKIMNFFNDL